MIGKPTSLATRALLTALAASGCATLVSRSLPARPPRSAFVVDPFANADCRRTTAGRRGVGYMRLDEAVDDPALLAELAGVPADVRRVARAAGLERSLIELLRAQATPAERPLELLAARLYVVTRIAALEIELDSLLFEADCYDEQVETVLLELERRTRKQQMSLTIASTAVSAIAALGAGLWELRRTDSDGPAVLGITGGAAAAALGFAALAPKRDRIVFAHERNLFPPIVTGEDPERLYPPFVFGLLTTPKTAEESTPREQLLADWQHIIRDTFAPPDRALAEAVLYSTGGTYDGALVEVRERMYDALKTQLNAINRDFEVLYRFTTHLLGDAKPP
ncbi:hypothetical protein [Nannocystis bainbridge]|uniref:Uncharacterized protein n=1 Tax=Nannocystis bainbridge TaxID=2995303 RepID=A0ABT5EA58_9BACT|nr:hypothetical protein [Nannocystis bainbridge]MDC0721666.1 hypothetical protein [Nannocystis bainbridge]